MENPSPRGKEHCKAIMLRSGKRTIKPTTDSIVAPDKELFDILGKEVPQIVTSMRNVQPSKLSTKPKVSTQSDVSLPLPFPKRFKENEQNKQKFMKELLSKKKKLSDMEAIALTEGCSTFLTNKFPSKMNDTKSFTIPCSIGNHYLCKALCNLGSSINLMLLSTFTKLGIGHMKPTVVTLQLADRFLAQPEGQIKDILVPVDKFIFSADFIILDCEIDNEVPIILGRPFLTTGRILIDVYKVIVSTTLDATQEEKLVHILKKHTRAIAWSIVDIQGISPSFCMHKIKCQDEAKESIEKQRRLNENMKEVVKKEIIKSLNVGIIYPISNSNWVTPVQCVHKKVAS
ncbi:uncharacterized protein LOC128283877 [Gossypium arboreum]|uniref:uncharacterized protein LOC128283877 n=1 Tax=Gossypium arboreum TaxID=29729 RepID=UPI0022F14CBB|nr:uncharacterized protein LOC128283877 [Gossypium arboreum]